MSIEEYKTIFPFAVVGHEMIITNSVSATRLVCYLLPRTRAHGIIVNYTFEKRVRASQKCCWNFNNYILSLILRYDQKAFPLNSSHSDFDQNCQYSVFWGRSTLDYDLKPFVSPCDSDDSNFFFRRDYFKWNNILLYCWNPFTLPQKLSRCHLRAKFFKVILLTWKYLNFLPLKTSCATSSLQLE